MRTLAITLVVFVSLLSLAVPWLYFFEGLTWFRLDQKALLNGAQAACIEQSPHAHFDTRGVCRPENGLDAVFFGQRLVLFVNRGEGDFSLTCEQDHRARRYRFGYYTVGLSSSGGSPFC